MIKRLLLSTVILTAALAASAQQFGYGIRGGVSIPSYSSGSNSSKSTVNFHVTGYLDAPIASNFSIQPGISLQGKGAKFAEVSLGNSDYELKQNTMWLEIPVNLVGKFPVGGVGHFFLGAGPYVSFGLSGKNKLDRNNSDGNTNLVDLDFDFGSDKTLKGTDFGLNFMTGYQFSNGFLIHGGYGLGLTNIAGRQNLSGDIKNRVWTVGIGFGI